MTVWGVKKKSIPALEYPLVFIPDSGKPQYVYWQEETATGVVVRGARLVSGLALVAPLSLGSLTTLIKQIRPHLYLDPSSSVGCQSTLGGSFQNLPMGHVSQNVFHPLPFWIAVRYKRVVYFYLLSN